VAGGIIVRAQKKKNTEWKEGLQEETEEKDTVGDHVSTKKGDRFSAKMGGVQKETITQDLTTKK